jgi:hypothetical protein
LRLTLLMTCLISAFLATVTFAAKTSSDPLMTGKHNTAEFFLGTAQSARTHLTISQSGQPDIGVDAKYETKPFTAAPYYAWRLGKWRNGHGTELEFIHHKIYLSNNPPDVQHFEVSHGYGMLMLNKAKERGGLIYHVGLGIVIAHTESTVRGLSFSSNYHLTGPSAQFAVGKRFRLSDRLFATVEGKLTAAYARVPVADGHATAPNIAVHALLGIGYAF